MSDLVYSEESVLIRSPSDNVSENPELEGEERSVAEVDSCADL